MCNIHRVGRQWKRDWGRGDEREGGGSFQYSRHVSVKHIHPSLYTTGDSFLHSQHAKNRNSSTASNPAFSTSVPEWGFHHPFSIPNFSNRNFHLKKPVAESGSHYHHLP